MLNLQSALFSSALIKTVTERICQKNHLDMKSPGYGLVIYSALALSFIEFKTILKPEFPVTDSTYFEGFKRSLKCMIILIIKKSVFMVT